MTAETLKVANEIIATIDNRKRWKDDIITDNLFKKNYVPPEGILEAARSAMLAVIDEEIAALEEKLEAL